MNIKEMCHVRGEHTSNSGSCGMLVYVRNLDPETGILSRTLEPECNVSYDFVMGTSGVVRWCCDHCDTSSYCGDGTGGYH